MNTTRSLTLNQPFTAKVADHLQKLLQEHSKFFLAMAGAFLLVGLTYRTPHIGMWVGFGFAAYAAVANDSIQTLGTFLASNGDRKWWQLWLFVAAVFVATITYSWYTYGGDVSNQRLAAKGFETAPTQFHFLQLAAPIFLIILTRFKMPVSTTFLLLSCFATSGKGLGAMIVKSMSGYLIAFVCSIVLWMTFGRWMQRTFQGKAHPLWRVGQWITTGLLWSVWLMQDAANIAVFLPRSLGVGELLIFLGAVVGGLAIIFRKGGEKIQQVVEEKADVVDVRAATMIDLLYAVILYVFKIVSEIPMSTTWVFVGLLAGREIAMAVRRANNDGRTVSQAFKLARKDFTYVSIGFFISLVIAAISNPVVASALFD